MHGPVGEQALKPVLARLADGATLNRAEARAAFEAIMSGLIDPPQIAAFLMAMRVRGETVDEITGGADVLRAKAATLTAPAGAVDTALRDQIQTEVLEPAVAGMAAEGTPFVGILYAGLMRTDRGIQVLEFNCRFGDPETQVVLPLLAGDIVAIFQACIDGELARAAIEWHSGACVTVVVASGGYPAAYRSGIPIEGIATADALDDVTVFHAGTALHDGRVVTSGGRVVAVTGRGADLAAATAAAYRGAARIDFEGAYYRSDIAAGAAVERA